MSALVGAGRGRRVTAKARWLGLRPKVSGDEPGGSIGGSSRREYGGSQPAGVPSARTLSPAAISGRAPISSKRSLDHSTTPHLIDLKDLFGMCALLIGLVQVKFQNEQSPFETHRSFIIMSLVSLTLAALTDKIVADSKKKQFKTFSNWEHFSSLIIYTILKIVYSFSVILAPLGLVLVLFIPHGLNWIGYSIICALFVVIVAYHFGVVFMLFHKKSVCNLGAQGMVQKDETLSQSSLIIND